MSSPPTLLSPNSDGYACKLDSREPMMANATG